MIYVGCQNVGRPFLQVWVPLGAFGVGALSPLSSPELKLSLSQSLSSKMSASGVVEAQPDYANTTAWAWNNTSTNTTNGTTDDTEHLFGSLPLPIAVLLMVTFGACRYRVTLVVQ